MIKRIVLLFITVFSFSTGVFAGTNFMNYIFRDYNLAVAQAAADEAAENPQEGGKVYSTTGSIKINSSTNEKSSPKDETQDTNDDNEVIKVANSSF